jgi:cell fate regulator YaaT (PSP1 superfamily)
VRDETKIIGGYGICGRPLCCHSYLSDFVPVSIKMAKEQSLSLNPTKISGVCGRLMCCLKNEEDVYEELNRKMPAVGDYCIAKDGLGGEVSSVNILRQTMKILVEVNDEKEVHEYKLDEIETIRKKQKKKNNNGKKNSQEDAEMKELEKLEKIEKQEGKSKLGDN